MYSTAAKRQKTEKRKEPPPAVADEPWSLHERQPWADKEVAPAVLNEEQKAYLEKVSCVSADTCSPSWGHTCGTAAAKLQGCVAGHSGPPEHVLAAATHADCCLTAAWMEKELEGVLLATVHHLRGCAGRPEAQWTPILVLTQHRQAGPGWH